MSDDTGTPQPEDQPGHAHAAAPMIAGLGSGERLLGLGAVLFFVNFLLFELILDEYTIFTGTLLVAGYALLALWVRHNRPSAKWPLPYVWLMWVFGLTAGFLGLIELLDDLRYGVLDNGADILGGLLGYGAALLMFLGGRQLKSSDGT